MSGSRRRNEEFKPKDHVLTMLDGHPVVAGVIREQDGLLTCQTGASKREIVLAEGEYSRELVVTELSRIGIMIGNFEHIGLVRGPNKDDPRLVDATFDSGPKAISISMITSVDCISVKPGITPVTKWRAQKAKSNRSAERGFKSAAIVNSAWLGSIK